MRKSFWLLATFLMFVGCGGFSPKINQDTGLPPPTPLFQGSSLLSAGQIDPDQFDRFTSNGKAKPQSNAAFTLNCDSEIAFCYQMDSSLFRERPEEGFSAYAPSVQSRQFSALEEEIADSDSQTPLSETAVSIPEALPQNAGLRNHPSRLPRKNRLEKGDKDSGLRRIGEKSEKKIEAQDLTASVAVIEAEDPPQESISPSEKDTISPSYPSPEVAPQETPEGNKSPSNLLAAFPTLLNEKVKKFIDLFQTKADTFFTQSLARSQAYESMMKRIFREKNLPEDLVYVALIESGFNPYALSRSKASGIWQFMTKTAKRFGLKVDAWVDERRDPEKSTYAAAEYLKNLYEIFNCWYLATASYNAGEGKILEAMKRTHSQDFWEISKYRYLKKETKEYVPMLLAAMIIARDPQKYGFSQVNYLPPLSYEKVAVPPGTRLDRIARAAQIDMAEFRALNPSLRRDKTPPDGSSFEIKLPPEKKEVFERNFFKIDKGDSRNPKTHQVRRGETLAQIAKKYRASLQELCEFNHISPKTTIQPGTTLSVPP